MVATGIITRSNARFASPGGSVCVFMGATSGIGRATLSRMTTMLQSSTFYVLGRDPPRQADWLEKMKTQAHKRSNKIVFIETQVSLVADIDKVCQQIKATEKKVDYICMSSGGMPFAGAKYTEEGLEACFALSYYCRLRLVNQLLPLLQQSPRPHVLAILDGTKETAIDEQDIGLNKKWTIMGLVKQSGLFTSLAFNYLAANDPHNRIVFLHSTPGFVDTKTPRREEHLPTKNDGILWWLFLSIMQIVSGWFMASNGMRLEESGERNAYHLTNDETYQPGSWQIFKTSDVNLENTVVQEYQDRGWADKVWDHTQNVWEKALAKDATS